VLEAPQAADVAFWSAPAPAPQRHAPFQALFAGRLEREKGVELLVEAWRAAGLDGALVLCGSGPLRPAGAVAPGALDPPELRNYYAGSDVVVVPSIPRRDFLEPWGMVVNEAFHQGVPVIASTAVGAVAGGLVAHERTGLVVPAGDPSALAGALRRLHADPELRARLGAAARAAVAAYTPQAWAAGMSRALAAAGAGRAEGGC
jgi:glycosyltransferase involved in cell wall biosynthesis